MSSRVVRLGVSLEPELSRSPDRWVAARNPPSRSDAVRSLVRKELSDEELAAPAADAVGTVLRLCRHTAPNVLRRRTAAEHRWGEPLRSSTHVRRHGDACLELLVLAGRRGELVRAAEDLRGVTGILEGDYVLGTPKVAGGRTGHRHPHDAPGPRRARRAHGQRNAAPR